MLSIFFYPLLLEGIGLRKLHMDECVRDAISSRERKINQVPVVAGGYDGLAWRMSREFSSVNVFEVDHPATGGVKQHAMARLDASCENLDHVLTDLTECTLKQAVEKADNFDMRVPTIVAMEGLLMYLTQDQIIGMFRDVAKIVGEGSIVCFDFLAWNHAVNRVDMNFIFMVHGLVNNFGEPWYFGLERSRLQAFFQIHLPMYSVTDQQPRVGIENVACATLVKRI